MIPKKIHYIWFGGNPLTPPCREVHRVVEEVLPRLRDCALG